MFNLIISIIAIALVVALAGASLYYGGDAFSKGSSEAKAATYVNQAQQIQAAATLFRATSGSKPATVAALTPSHLASLPKVAMGTGSWEIDSTLSIIYVAQELGDSAEDTLTTGVCDEINEGGAGVVLCLENADDSAPTATPTVAVSDTSTHAVVFMNL